MVFFAGPIDRAVGDSLASAKLLVVLVSTLSPPLPQHQQQQQQQQQQHPPDSASAAFLAAINAPSVASFLRSFAVALHLPAGSAEAALFAQIYPVFETPAIYIIRSGVCVDLVLVRDGELTESGLRTRLEKAYHQNQNQNQNQINTQNNNQTNTRSSSSSSMISTGASSASAATTATALVDSDSAKITQTKNQNQSQHEKKSLNSSSSGNDTTKQKASSSSNADSQKKEDLKSTSNANQNEGNSNSKSTSSQDLKTSKIHIRRLADTPDQNKGSQDIIKESKSNNTPPSSSKLAGVLSKKQILQESGSMMNDNNTTIQQNDVAALAIRLPDGTTLRQKFNQDQTLLDVKKFIQEQITGIQPFSLFQIYPPRDFLPSDDTTSLKNLNLVPSQTLIVKILPPTMMNTTTQAGMSIVLSPVVLVCNILMVILKALMGMLIPSGQSPHESTPTEPTSSSTTMTSSATPTTVRKRVMHKTLADLAAEDDKKKGDKGKETYNGNSTSQE